MTQISTRPCNARGALGIAILSTILILVAGKVPSDRSVTAKIENRRDGFWTSITCEWAAWSTIDLCPFGIEIYSVKYGRQKLKSYCSGYEGLPWNSKGVVPSCQVSVLDEFQKMCPENSLSCDIPVTNDDLGIDPCWNYLKYLSVDYNCDDASNEVVYKITSV